MKNKFFLATALLFFTFASWASDISVDGIWYTFNRTNITATVSYRGASSSTYSNEYTGSVVIPSTITYNDTVWRVTSIGNSAFRSCTGVTSVTIPSGVTSIGNSAFKGCTSLLSVSIPNSVTSIQGQVFSGCTSLLYVSLPNQLTSVADSMFYNCSGLTSITIPNSATEIGNSAFYKCTSLKSIDIPNNVTTLGHHAFSGCTALTSVTIPYSVTTFRSSGAYYYTFLNCTALRTIYNYNTTPQNANNTTIFQNVDKSLCTLYVPSTAVEAYRSATGWKDFTNIESVPDLTITVFAEHATTFGTGSYPMTQNAVIAVTADEGWRFVRWSDGNTDNPRIVTVTGNATYTAVMEKTSFTIRVGQDCNVTVE